jgi:hypothetical protein
MATLQEMMQALNKADAAGATDDAQRIADMIRRRYPEAAGAAPAAAPEGDTQYMRSFFQGITFKGADEAEAWARATFNGEDYDTVLADVRKKIKSFEKTSPVSAILTETAGAAIPAILATIGTGGAAAPTTTATIFPMLARLAAVGGVEGLLAGVGGAEGGIRERAIGGAAGAVTGAALAPAAGAGLSGLGKLGSSFLEFVRRRSGGRGGSVVENEIRRITESTGLTVDEIVERIRSGEVMAEFPALMYEVRNYYTGGGAPAATIRQALTERPPMLREQAQAQLRAGLAPDSVSPNVLRAARESDEAARQVEKARYAQAFETGGVVEGPMLQDLATALERAPDARKNINKLLQAQGRQPFFNLKGGKVNIDRAVTFEDAEIARRGIADTIDKSFREGLGAVGGALKDVEQALRAQIDKAAPQVGQARAFAAGRRGQREAFEQGRMVFGKGADEQEMLIESLRAEPNKLAVFRSGVMDAIRRRMESGNKVSTYQRLADPETKEGRILRMVYPGDQLEDVLGSLSRAARSQQAAGDVLRQSATQGTQAAAARQGTGAPSPEDLLRATQFDIFSLTRLARQAINSAAPMLSEREKARVVNVLVSQDPAIVRQALTDERALARLIAATTLGAQRITAPLPGLTSIIGGGAAGEAFTGAQ